MNIKDTIKLNGQKIYHRSCISGNNLEQYPRRNNIELHGILSEISDEEIEKKFIEVLVQLILQ